MRRGSYIRRTGDSSGSFFLKGQTGSGLQQRGMGLVIVVWFIAGMSLLVAGIVSIARVDTHMAQLHLARAKVAAAGDGAIHLMMAEQYLSNDAESVGGSVPERIFQLGDIEVAVALYPAAGHVDLNSAPLEILEALFLVIGHVGEGEAKQLADNVVKWREGTVASDAPRSAAQTFHAVEDILRVEGVRRTLLDRIRDYVVAGPFVQGSIDWAVVPVELLAVVEKARPDDLAAIHQRRESLDSSAADSRSDKNRAKGPSGAYRVDAQVRYGDKMWLRRRWVATDSTAGSTLPWRVVRTEVPRVYEAPQEVY